MAIELISTNFIGAASQGSATGAGVSAGGRYVVYVSDAADIAGGRVDQPDGVYVKDLLSGRIERIDQAVGGGAPDGAAYKAQISGDGRYVVYSSSASNLIEDGKDQNGASDIYLFDRMTGQTRLVSALPDGTAAGGHSDDPVISENGQFIAFRSTANDIPTNRGVPVDYNTRAGSSDIFVFEVATGVLKNWAPHYPDYIANKMAIIENVFSITNDGFPVYHETVRKYYGDGSDTSRWEEVSGLTVGTIDIPASSHNGQLAAGHSPDGKEYIASYGGSHSHGGATFRIEGRIGLSSPRLEDDRRIPIEEKQTSIVRDLVMAANGRFVVYTSNFDHGRQSLTEGLNLYLWDMDTGSVVTLLVAPRGGPFTGVQISADGRWITFESSIPLTDDDTNGRSDIYRIQNPIGTAGGSTVEKDFPDHVQWIVGSNDWDDIEGTQKADNIRALEGNDTVYAFAGDDTVLGGGGADTIFGGTGVDRISGGDEDDTLHGDASRDSAHGLGGSMAGDDVDFIDGGAGNDTIYGNGGDDRIEGGAGADVIQGGDGENVINGGRNESGIDYLHGGSETDVIHGDDGDEAFGDNDFIYGREGKDFLFGDGGDDILYGHQDADLLRGGAGRDTLFGGENARGRDALFGGAGDDTLYGDSEADDGLLDGEDDLDGGEGSDTLNGGGGNDILIGGTNDEGYDKLFGDDGNDELYGDRKDDDTDTVEDGDGGDLMDGGAGDDVLVGNGGEDELRGGDDSDHIRGGGDADHLFGGTADNGYDDLDGGAGNDVIFGDSAELGADLKWHVTETSRDSKDLIRGGAGIDRIFGGGGADEIWGDEDLDYIDSGSGDDTVIGGAGVSDGEAPFGAEVIIGGTGDDLLIGDTAVAGEDLEFIALETDDDDQDMLEGEAGNDRIYGCGGDDLLDGGADHDILVGGTGSDTILGDEGEDTLYADLLLDDSLPGLTGFAPGARSRTSAAPASDDRDLLDGGAGDDTLHAGRNSTLIGGTGRDTFVLGTGTEGSVIEDFVGGAGGDRIDFSSVLFEIGENWDPDVNLFATGHLRLEVRGEDTVLLFDADGSAGAGQGVEIAVLAGVEPSSLTADNFLVVDRGFPVIADPTRASIQLGTEGSETLIGTEGADTIAGLGGDDIIFGRGGGDELVGGSGRDTLHGEGGADMLRGGHGDDVMLGGEGNDTFVDGEGHDRMDGGDGDDVFYMGEGRDTVIGGAGSDTIMALRSYGDQDVVLDFQAGLGSGDVIDLTKLTGVYTFEQLKSRLTTDANGDVRIMLDQRTNTHITLKGVKPTDLAADDFRFARDPDAPTDPVNGAPSSISFDNPVVAENAGVGARAGRATGVDPDGDTLAYSLTDDAGGRFAIDAITGVIKATRDFDHETDAAFTLVVRATDPAGLHVDRPVTIQIADVNEAPRSIVMDTAAVDENAPAGTLVGTAAAADPDGEGVTYSLVDDAGGLFVIDPETGAVTTTRPFDHETETAFEIVVRATDAGGLFVDLSQTIMVGDVNEAPVNLAIDGSSVDENAAAGALVGAASAQDPEGDALSYGLLDDAEGRFRIDAATGRITTTRALDHEATPSLRIVVRATDAHGAFVDRETIITVNDVAETPTTAGDDGPIRVDEDATTANLWSLLLANDVSGAASGDLSITSVNTAGTRGSLVFDAATKTLKYVADADAFDLLATGASTTDSFTYTVTDANGQTSTATVTFDVRGVADGRVIKGGAGKDTLTGTAGDDIISGENGNDILHGLDGADRLDGGNGADKLYGGAGIDALMGGNGDDLLDGGAGADRLDGGHGQDQLFGGLGDDFILGGGGHDLLTGGAGADAFVFGIASDIDKILDFEVGKDRLEFTQGVEVSFHETLDNNNDGKLDTVLVTNLGGVIIMLGVEYPVGPSLEELLRPVWAINSPHGLVKESLDFM